MTGVCRHSVTHSKPCKIRSYSTVLIFLFPHHITPLLDIRFCSLLFEQKQLMRNTRNSFFFFSFFLFFIYSVGRKYKLNNTKRKTSSSLSTCYSILYSSSITLTLRSPSSSYSAHSLSLRSIDSNTVLVRPLDVA